MTENEKLVEQYRKIESFREQFQRVLPPPGPAEVTVTELREIKDLLKQILYVLTEAR